MPCPLSKKRKRKRQKNQRKRKSLLTTMEPTSRTGVAFYARGSCLLQNITLSQGKLTIGNPPSINPTNSRRYKKHNGMTHAQLHTGIMICRECHSAIHKFIDNK